MIVQSVVNGFGMIFIAGFTATNKLYGILEIAATSYGYAMISYVGQNLGARKIERIRAGQRAAIGLAMATSCIIAAVMIGFGRWIVGCFISGTPQEVEAATQVAYRYLDHHERVPAGFVCAACHPLLRPGDGEHGASHALRRLGICDAHRRGVAAADGHGAGGHFLCGSSGMGRRGSDSGPQLFRGLKKMQEESCIGLPVRRKGGSIV